MAHYKRVCSITQPCTFCAYCVSWLHRGHFEWLIYTILVSTNTLYSALIASDFSELKWQWPYGQRSCGCLSLLPGHPLPMCLCEFLCLWCPLEHSIPNPHPQVSCPERLMSSKIPLKRNCCRQVRMKPSRLRKGVAGWFAVVPIQVYSYWSPLSCLPSASSCPSSLHHGTDPRKCFILPLVVWSCTSYELQVFCSIKEGSMLVPTFRWYG